MIYMERSPLVRINKLDQCLRSRAYCSVSYLMQEIEISRRTLFRDLNTLQEMGAPLSYSRQYNGYYYVSGHKFRLPEVDLTEGDLLAVMLTEQAISSLDKSYLDKKIQPCLDKLRLAFQKKMKIAPSKAFSFAATPQPVLTENTANDIEKILKAIGENKKIACEYKTPNHAAPTKLIIEPYHLHFRGKWYLFGWSEHSKAFRTYVISRMNNLNVTKESFMQRVFDQSKYLGDAWGIVKGKKTKVVLDFAAEQYMFLQEKIWHPSQKLTKPKNGRVRMTLLVDGLDGVAWWILSYGSKVKVIEPAELRDIVKQEARDIAKQY